MARIVLVEDDPTLRSLLKTALCAEGHLVEDASQGLDALALFRDNLPDLVITDLLMPDMDGLEVIVEMRKIYPQVKIIAMSGGGKEFPETYLQIARNMGATLVLPKPFGLQDLLEIVDQALALEESV